MTARSVVLGDAERSNARSDVTDVRRFDCDTDPPRSGGVTMTLTLRTTVVTSGGYSPSLSTATPRGHSVLTVKLITSTASNIQPSPTLRLTIHR